MNFCTMTPTALKGDIFMSAGDGRSANSFFRSFANNLVLASPSTDVFSRLVIQLGYILCIRFFLSDAWKFAFALLSNDVRATSSTSWASVVDSHFIVECRCTVHWSRTSRAFFFLHLDKSATKRV